MLAIATDYAEDKGCPEPYLRRIAEAGFKWIHWCHHWCTDFMYGDAEIEQIVLWLKEHGLAVNDLHGSHGVEKAWGAPEEYARLAGIELVKNRIDMIHRLSGDVVVMHLPKRGETVDEPAWWDRFRRTLDALEPYARERGVRIALENGWPDNFDAFERVFEDYGPDFIGVCYDSGHGNIAGNGLERLERVKERLIAVHLHDNDGDADQHKPISTGTIDWARLADIIARSGYNKRAMTIEVSVREAGIEDEAEFLAFVLETGRRFDGMVAKRRDSAS